MNEPALSPLASRSGTAEETALGCAILDPSAPVIAGEMGTWTLTLKVGRLGIDEGGTIKVARRFASDWEAPQFDRPEASGYTTIETTGAARLAPRYSTKGEVRPWMRAIIIDVFDGELIPGDLVRVIFGDRRRGSPGMRAQTFVETRHTFRVLVDPTNACLPRDLEVSPAVQILPGPLASVTAIAPSQVWSGQVCALRLRGEDQWNNSIGPVRPESLTWVGTGEVRISQDGVFEPIAAGAGRFKVMASGHTVLSNPVCLYDHEPLTKHFWGDLHAQSDSTIGTGSEEEYFSFARENACLDFVGHQANDFQLTDENYQVLEETIRRVHQDGSFVVIPGYEWSGNTSAGGDRNVFFDALGQPMFRSCNWQIPAGTKYAEAHPADELFRRLRENGHALVCSHVGGRYANVRDYYDEEVCRLIEVTSCWGIFEWLVRDALEKGYRFGIVANSDGHKGRPGAEGPGAGEFGIRGGLTCVLGNALRRAEIFAALSDRSCYGTTGPRILISFSVNGNAMGCELTAAGSIHVQGVVRGCAPLEKVEIMLGTKVIKVLQPDCFTHLFHSSKVRVSWKGARHRGRGRRVRWDGELEVEGNKIVSAKTVAFDSRSDGILESGATKVRFRSSTTGDTDGIELELEEPSTGRVILRSAEGTWEVTLAGLHEQRFPLGTLEREVTFQRYPADPQELDLEFAFDHPLEQSEPPGACYLKVSQTDGHLAWSSPIFLHQTSTAPAPAEVRS